MATPLNNSDATTGAPVTGTVATDAAGDTAVLGTSAAYVGGEDGPTPGRTPGAPVGTDLRDRANAAVERVKVEAGRGREQALAAASTYADEGRGKAANALTSLSGLLIEGAKLLEENFGHRAADPVRAQADRLTGTARHLETTDVDQLATELKTFAKNNPLLSVGTIAVVGFALGKLLGGSDQRG